MTSLPEDFLIRTNSHSRLTKVVNGYPLSVNRGQGHGVRVRSLTNRYPLTVIRYPWIRATPRPPKGGTKNLSEQLSTSIFAPIIIEGYPTFRIQLMGSNDYQNNK